MPDVARGILKTFWKKVKHWIFKRIIIACLAFVPTLALTYEDMSEKCYLEHTGLTL